MSGNAPEILPNSPELPLGAKSASAIPSLRPRPLFGCIGLSLPIFGLMVALIYLMEIEDMSLVDSIAGGIVLLASAGLFLGIKGLLRRERWLIVSALAIVLNLGVMLWLIPPLLQ